LKITGFLLLVIFIIGLLAFTSVESKDVMCTDIEVSFNDNDLIHVNKKEILRLVNAADSKVLSKSFAQINSEIIETEVEKHKAIQKAEVYKIVRNSDGKYSGLLVVKVKHRKPILRIMSESGNYYLDKYGNKVPASSNYTTNVLVASGYISEKFAREQLLPFVLYVEDDDFWKAQIEQIYVEKDGDVFFTPLIGEHIIELGDTDNYKAKLRKMRAFYDQVLVKNSWNKYKTISLKYNNQVIAKRK
jgi:cell division protein FtsQ